MNKKKKPDIHDDDLPINPFVSLKSGQDWLWINKDRYMKEHGIKSIKTVNSALHELDNKRFIDAVAGMRDVFFINPAIFFNGSRINKYPECVVRYE